MKEMTDWIEQFSIAIEARVNEDPQILVEALKLAKEFSETPTDTVILMMQSAFLILLSFETASSKDELGVTSVGLFPALLALSNEWAETQVEYLSEINENKQQGDLLKDAYSIINKRENGRNNTNANAD